MALTAITDGESGSSVRTKLNNILGIVVNVKDHGAIGDGSTNDTTAITDAIAAAPEGSIIYFPTGTYLVTTAIAIDKAISFKGDGSHASTVSTSSATITVFSFNGTSGDHLTGITISDIGFVNTVTASAGGALKFTFTAQLRMQNVYVNAFHTNINLVNSYAFTFTDCYISAFVNHGLLYTNTDASVVDWGDGSIGGCTFGSTTGFHSIYQQNGGGLKIVNTKFSGSTGSSRPDYHYRYVGAGVTVDTLISNCSFENFDVSAIKMELSSGSFENIVITGNQFGYGNTTTYIDINNMDHIAIVGNVLLGEGGTTAITLTSCEDVLVSNQMIGFSGTSLVTGAPTNLTAFNSNGINLIRTITAGGTTGAQTINKPSGTVNFAAAATSLVVTNSLVTASSIIICTIRTNDSTAVIKNVVPGSGSFTITLNAAATAETSVGFLVLN